MRHVSVLLHAAKTLSSLCRKTNVCQRAQRYLSIAVDRAHDAGLLEYDVHMREYDYADYYPQEMLQPGYKAESS